MATLDEIERIEDQELMDTNIKKLTTTKVTLMEKSKAPNLGGAPKITEETLRQDCKGLEVEEEKILSEVYELIQEMAKHTKSRSILDKTFKDKTPEVRVKKALLLEHRNALKEAKKKLETHREEKSAHLHTRVSGQEEETC